MWVAVVNRDGDLLVVNDSFRDLFNAGSSEREIPAELTVLFRQSSLSSGGIVEFEGESVSVSDILDTVLPLFISRARDKGITITADQITPNLTVNADHHPIEQVFVSLKDNTVKYTDSGFIQISAAKKGNQAVFAVSDTGRGIPREAIVNEL